MVNWILFFDYKGVQVGTTQFPNKLKFNNGDDIIYKREHYKVTSTVVNFDIKEVQVRAFSTTNR